MNSNYRNMLAVLILLLSAFIFTGCSNQKASQKVSSAQATVDSPINYAIKFEKIDDGFKYTFKEQSFQIIFPRDMYVKTHDQGYLIIGGDEKITIGVKVEPAPAYMKGLKNLDAIPANNRSEFLKGMQESVQKKYPNATFSPGNFMKLDNRTCASIKGSMIVPVNQNSFATLNQYFHIILYDEKLYFLDISSLGDFDQPAWDVVHSFHIM